MFPEAVTGDSKLTDGVGVGDKATVAGAGDLLIAADACKAGAPCGIPVGVIGCDAAASGRGVMGKLEAAGPARFGGSARATGDTVGCSGAGDAGEAGVGSATGAMATPPFNLAGSWFAGWAQAANAKVTGTRRSRDKVKVPNPSMKQWMLDFEDRHYRAAI